MSSNDKEVIKSLLIRFTVKGVVIATISYAVVGLIIALIGKGAASNYCPIWLPSLYWGICGGIGGLFWGLLCGSRALKWFLEEAKAGSAEPARGVVRGGTRYGVVLGIFIAILSFVVPGRPITPVHSVIRIALYISAGIWVGYVSSRSAWQSHVARSYKEVYGKNPF